MRLKARVWSAGKLMVLIGGLVATYALCFVVSMRLAVRAREVTVPNLAHRTTAEATAAVNALGLTLRVDDMRRPDRSIVAGRIVAQDPPPGAVARRQRSVRVWLSAGQRTPTVPSLVGETDRTAQLRLAQEGVALDGISEIRSDVYPHDVVVAQQPPAATRASNVAVLVNRRGRGARYVMPDLIGVQGDHAAQLLRSRGFRVAVTGSQPYPGVAPGVVLRHSPEAGFQIGPDETITLEVSR